MSASQRVVASVVLVGDRAQLLLGTEPLVLDGLEPKQLEWLARLARPILVEADVVVEGDRKRVVALGHPQPHPKVAALRAVNDQRYGAALESLTVLGDSVVLDLELLRARLRARAAVGRIAEAQADFEHLCAHAELDLATLGETIAGLPGGLREAVEPLATARVAALAPSAPSVSVGPLVLRSGIPLERWSPEVLLRAASEELAKKRVERSGLEQARAYLDAVRSRAPADPRLADVAAQIDAAAAKVAAREKKDAAKHLASRPDFGEVEALFGVTLPRPLREAWAAHYEGRTVGCGFVAVRKDEVAKLAKLAGTLERALPPELTRPAGALLPFAVGEHEDEHFVLDLSQRRDDGDFPVLVVFRDRGEAWTVYESSAAWIAADGLTRYE